MGRLSNTLQKQDPESRNVFKSYLSFELPLKNQEKFYVKNIKIKLLIPQNIQS